MGPGYLPIALVPIQISSTAWIRDRGNSEILRETPANSDG
jgi:hypothetical protein